MENLQFDFLSDTDRIFGAVRALIIVVAGYLAAKLASYSVSKLAARRLSGHHTIVLKRAVFYTIVVIFIISALHQLGFNLTVLVGAAGILTVAIGFASQTAASNLISGLFLLGERPFEIGDIIRVGTTTGEVLAIDLMSVKLRTFDNLYVRIPNESLLKAEVTTLTRFPIRRFDLMVGISYGDDIEKARDTLFAVAEKNPLCLEEPKPLFIVVGFGESSVDLQFSVWVKRENFLELKNSICIAVKKAFEENDIVIPYRHVTVTYETPKEAIAAAAASLDDKKNKV